MADPYVTPVWSADAGRLLYVSVAATRAQPGTRWTLHEYDLAAHRSTTLVGSTSMALFPLGWWKSQPLYAVADGTDTSLYTFSAGRAHFVSILQTQIVTSAGLSPSGRYIAMAVPTDCYRCSLDIFDLVHLKLWNGPTGMSDETQFAWSRAPEAVVTALSGTLAVVNPASHVVERFPPAGALPAHWSDSMAATISGGRVMLVDTVTGRSYESGRRISR
jgi:hypothetical protein